MHYEDNLGEILGLWTGGGTAEEIKLYYNILKLLKFIFRRQPSTWAVLIYNSSVKLSMSCLAIERLECNIQGGGAVINAQTQLFLSLVYTMLLVSSQKNSLSQIYSFKDWTETGKEKEGKDRSAVQSNILI